MKRSAIFSGMRYVAAIIVGVVTFGFLITWTSAMSFLLARHMASSSLWYESPNVLMGFSAPLLAILLTAWIAPRHKQEVAKAMAAYLALFYGIAFYRMVAGWGPPHPRIDPSYRTLVFLRYFLSAVGIGLGLYWTARPSHKVPKHNPLAG